MKKRFLFVSPHPDDVELGAGGTICKLVQAGHKVCVLDLTSGEPTPYGSEQKRQRETKKSSRILGIGTRINLALPNRFLFDSKEARLRLAEQIRIFKPDVLLCPYFEDAHPDHIACSKITEAARFYAKYSKISLRGGPHYPYYLWYYFCTHLRITVKISFCVDISGQFKDKMRAIRCYRSQFIDNPANRFVFDYIRAQNRYLGGLLHVEYAEALYSKEVLGVSDVASLL